MKGFYKNLISVVMVLLFTVFFSGCEDAETDETYSFEVISSGDGFNGYYKVDGGSAKEFTSGIMGTSSVYHSFEQNLDSPESVLIVATGYADTTSSISIYIYDNAELADSITVSPSAVGVAVTATLSYTFGSSSE